MREGSDEMRSDRRTVSHSEVQTTALTFTSEQVRQHEIASTTSPCTARRYSSSGGLETLVTRFDISGRTAYKQDDGSLDAGGRSRMKSAAAEDDKDKITAPPALRDPIGERSDHHEFISAQAYSADSRGSGSPMHRPRNGMSACRSKSARSAKAQPFSVLEPIEVLQMSKMQEEIIANGTLRCSGYGREGGDNPRLPSPTRPRLPVENCSVNAWPVSSNTCAGDAAC